MTCDVWLMTCDRGSGGATGLSGERTDQADVHSGHRRGAQTSARRQVPLEVLEWLEVFGLLSKREKLS